MVRRWMTRPVAGCFRFSPRDAMRSPRELWARRYRLPRRLVFLASVSLALVLIGTLGYCFIEGWSLLDGLYMTVITLSTIGYGEVRPLSDSGKVFTILLILGGVFTFLYTATEIIRAVVSGEVAEMLGKQQRELALAEVHNHIIVCGYGRMGQLVCREFARDEVPFVLIDISEEALHDLDLPGGLALVGDATSDEVLRHAGIDRARALVTVMASDADNLFTTLSARLLRSDLFIVARVEAVESEAKLLRAGANRVVSPYLIAGRQMALSALQPLLVESVQSAGAGEPVLAQLLFDREAAGVSIAALLGACPNTTVLALRRAGDLLVAPQHSQELQPGDELIVLGPEAELAQIHTGGLAVPARMPPQRG